MAGYDNPFRFTSPQGKAVAIEYKIPTGKHRGEKVLLGFSFGSEEESYPEYPPHWIHISPRYSDGLGGTIEEHTDENGRPWLTLSRPPQDIWDTLPTKHMSVYLELHITRFCERLQ